MVKGTHKPLIHPPSGFCREAEASFLYVRFVSGTGAARFVRIRTVVP